MKTKFRAWDKKEKRFIQFVSLNEDGSVSFLNSKALWQFDENERIIIQFYTGLKDKNKKEIHFDDICKLTVEFSPEGGSDYEDYVNYWYIGIVSFMPSLGYYLNVKKGFDIDNDEPLISLPKRKFMSQYRTELLGNNFENPNLLES